MKVTRELVKLFKKDQKAYGTKVAITNLLYLQADTQLKELGVKTTKTTYKGKR